MAGIRSLSFLLLVPLGRLFLCLRPPCSLYSLSIYERPKTCCSRLRDGEKKSERQRRSSEIIWGT